jgi:hypothetical protein
VGGAMKDGSYKIDFKSPLGTGSGVMHAHGGKLWGGDAGLYYIGTYSQTGNRVTATVKTFRHAQPAGTRSVFSKDQLAIALNGTAEDDCVHFSGSAPEAPGLSISAVMRRISD